MVRPAHLAAYVLAAALPTVAPAPALAGCIFDEEDYLRTNPDVADALRKGWLSSGWDHFAAFGKAEGRQGCGVAVADDTVDEVAAFAVYRTSAPGPAPNRGWVNSAVRGWIDVRPGTETFEWGTIGVVRLRPGVTAGEHVGSYGQAWAPRGATAPVWGGVSEVARWDGDGTAVGHEITLRLSGVTRHGIGLDIPLHTVEPGLPPPTAQAGVRLAPQPGNTFERGFYALGVAAQYPRGVLSVPECSLAVAINERPGTGLRFCAGRWELVTDGVARPF